MRITFLATAASSIAIHAGVAFALSNVPPPPGLRPSTVVRMEVRSPVMPPEPKPIAVDAPMPKAPMPVVAKKPQVVHRAEAPRPKEQAPKETPKPELAPVKPVFGLNLAATTVSEGSVSVPLGNTMAADPSAARPQKIDPLPAGEPTMGAPVVAKSEPAVAKQIRTLPQIDTRGCGKLIEYPPEAEQLGIEGDVTLRVALDATGHAHNVKVLRGLGHGLDRTAVHALEHLCRFTPAIATDGTPVPYVIEEYVFHFEIPR